MKKVRKNRKSENTMKGLLDWIVECNSWNSSHFVDFIIEDITVGAIHCSRLELLKSYPQIFQVFSNRVKLHPRLDSPAARTEAVDAVLRNWRKKGIIQGWRDEQYRVTSSFDRPPLMLVERSAAPFFGVINYGVHLNGFTEKEGNCYMWLARRSAQKSRFPGHLDHLVAGGHTAGMSTRQVMLKECHEEAGIPGELARQAQPAGAISFCMDEYQTLRRDVLFVYDLKLPENFVPQNMDGEVAEFFLWSLAKVLETVACTRTIKTNCNLVMIDFLVRHGYLCPDDPHYLKIVHGLRGLDWRPFL